MSYKLFLGGISPNTSKESLEQHFGAYGVITDAVVMYKDGKHRGFGFVTFEDLEAMNAALAVPQVIDGRTVDVKEAVPQGEAPLPKDNGFRGGGGAYGGGGYGGGGYGGGDPGAYAGSGKGGGKGGGGGGGGNKVFIGGLAQTTTDDMLREYFSRYGDLVDVVVMKDRMTGKSRGFGFIQYDQPGPVDAVIAEYSSHQIDGKWVEVKSAVSKDQMGGPPTRAGPPMGGKGAPLAYKGAGKSACGGGYGGGAYGGAYGGGGVYVSAGYGSAPPPSASPYYQFSAAPSTYGGYGSYRGGYDKGKGAKGYRAGPY